MAKRLTDSRKWYDPWYRKLSKDHKLFWHYLTDICDHAGFWKVDIEMASFCIGETLILEDILAAFNTEEKQRVHVLRKDLWFVPTFIEFQYGVLNPNNNLHKSIKERIEKAGVGEGLPSPSATPMVKVKDKDKDKDKVKNKDKITIRDFQTIWEAYPATSRIGRKKAEKHFFTSVKTDNNIVDIHQALKNYLKSERVLKGYVQNGSTWFNNWRDWIDYEQEKSNSKPLDTRPNYIKDGRKPDLKEKAKVGKLVKDLAEKMK